MPIKLPFRPVSTSFVRRESACFHALVRVVSIICAVAVVIFPQVAFGGDVRTLLGKFEGVLPDSQAERLEKALSEGVSRTPKSGYEYVLWDVATADVGSSLDRNTLLICALVIACSSQSSFPLVKVDVVKITAQDAYGKPRWDTAQRLGHIEVPREGCQRIVDATRPFTVEEVASIPSQAKIHL